MADFISLEFYKRTDIQYFVYKTHNSAMDRQPHYHDYFQVCMVISGALLHKQGQETVRLETGDAFVIPPGVTHALHFDTPDAEIYSLVFLETLFHPGFNKSNIHSFLTGLKNEAMEQCVQLRITPNMRQRDSIVKMMGVLVAEQMAQIPASLSAAPSIISAILYLLAQSYYRKPREKSPIMDDLMENDTLQQCIRYIDHHYKEKLSLETFTKKFGISRSALCAAFPQYTGVPLRRYITQKRIQEAQLRIRSAPEESLSQIGAAVGYEDDSTFYRNFVKTTGMSPSQYRAAQGNTMQENSD